MTQYLAHNVKYQPITVSKKSRATVSCKYLKWFVPTCPQRWRPWCKKRRIHSRSDAKPNLFFFGQVRFEQYLVRLWRQMFLFKKMSCDWFNFACVKGTTEHMIAPKGQSSNIILKYTKIYYILWVTLYIHTSKYQSLYHKRVEVANCLQETWKWSLMLFCIFYKSMIILDSRLLNYSNGQLLTSENSCSIFA